MNAQICEDFGAFNLFLTTCYQCHEIPVLILGLTVTSGERGGGHYFQKMTKTSQPTQNKKY